MDKSSRRYFIALLPPVEIQDVVTQIKHEFARYDSYGALNSPPHVTLQPPFEWPHEQVPALEQCLSQFAAMRSPFPIVLSGFGAFPDRVIYVNVIQTPALLSIQADLMAHLETNLEIVDPTSKQRSYSPHVTVAFKDLSKANFKAAWPEYKDRPLQYIFTASQLTLLLHNGQRWNIYSEYPFPE